MLLKPISISAIDNDFDASCQEDEEDTESQLQVTVDTLYSFVCGGCLYGWQILNWQTREVVTCPDCGRHYEVTFDEEPG